MKVTCKLLIIIILYSFYKRSKRLFEEYDEDIYDEDIYDEDIYDEDIYDEFLKHINNRFFNLENY